MATFINKLGLVTWLANNMQAAIGSLCQGRIVAVIILSAVYLYSYYFFASTTANITAMFAAFYAAGLRLSARPMLFALILTAVANLMMGLKHYATGTAPVIFDSGYTTPG